MSIKVERKTSNDLFERGPKKVLDESTRAVIKRLYEKEGKGIERKKKKISKRRKYHFQKEYLNKQIKHLGVNCLVSLIKQILLQVLEKKEKNRTIPTNISKD